MSVSKQDVISGVLSSAQSRPVDSVNVYAPANIALCKYWGKRNAELNLPITSSLSLSLGRYGSALTLSRIDREDDVVIHNGEELDPNSTFVMSLVRYLDLFRNEERYRVETHNTIPTAAGFASSASGFAAVAMGLDAINGWGLSRSLLSILARLGSGSASRSVYDGLVVWEAGRADDGMDSYAVPLEHQWPELRIGLHVLSDDVKAISSREAMQHTVQTSPLYESWPTLVSKDLAAMKAAINAHDFSVLGSLAEGNAMAMHATMQAARPGVLYWTPETVETLKEVRISRDSGLDLYCTMDAGPNVKLLFLADAEADVKSRFPHMLVASAFEASRDGPDA